jgi:hypothetical protein
MQLLVPATFLKRYSLIGMDGQTAVIGRGRQPCQAQRPIPENLTDGAVALQSPERGDPLLLSPIVVYRVCLFQLKSKVCHKRLFLFYSDRKSKKAVTLQDYTRGHWARDPEIVGEFIRRLPLAEWRHGEVGRFDSLIEEKTREFVGRCKEVAEVKRWVERNECGFCLIRGAPGVGKSALMSALSQIGSASLEETFEDPDLVALLNGDSWPKVSVIPYFVVRGEITTSPVEFLSTLLEKLGRRYDRPCVNIGTADELASELQCHLQVISKILRERGEKLIVLIDGLDESVSAEGEASGGMSLLRYIPRNVPPGVFIVLAGRRRKEVDALGGDLRKASRLTEMELHGLEEKDVRDLLELTISEFDVDADYVKEVTRLSQGNPLYVKLLLEALLERHIRLNDVQTLPQNIQAFYGDIVERLSATERQARVQILMILALARELLTVEQLMGITGQSEETVHRALDACAEVITERRNVNGRAVYRLFHDSFGDFMRSHKDHAGQVPELSQRILEFAARRVAHRPAEAELIQAVERLYDGTALAAAVAPLLSLLIERTSHMLTSCSLIRQNLQARPVGELGPLLAALARCVGDATARMTVDCLLGLAEQQPEEAGRLCRELVERPTPGRGAAVAPANTQAARIAMETAVQVCEVPTMADAVKTVLLAACAAGDSNIRSLGITAVFRVFHGNYALGLAILQQMCDRSLWCGLVRPRKLEAFAGCALGLFLERQHDEQLLGDLQQMVRRLIGRVRGLRLAVWLLPKAASMLWASAPDDYNPMNLAELKAYKKYVAKHPDLVKATNEILNFADPRHGTAEQFAAEAVRLDSVTARPEAFVGTVATQQALEIRALAGEDSALEAAWQSWQQAAHSEYGMRQEFMWRLRIVQVGRALMGAPPLGREWTTRMEEAMRDFLCRQHGVFQGACNVYAVGGAISGLVFLSHESGHGRPPLLEELVDWACHGPNNTVLRWPNTARDRQPDALLLRLIEVVGVEAGLSAPVCRETAFFGIRRFLQHAGRFDDALPWDRLATILARMNIYHSSDVGQFLAGLAEEHREALRTRMQRITPRENVGSLLSNYRLEAFIASVMAEPPDKEHSFRAGWLECFRLFIGPKNLAATIRFAMRKLVEQLLHESQGTLLERA